VASKRLALALILVAVAPAVALAEESDEEAEKKPGVRISVGAGMAYTPKYPGADSYSVRFIPVLGFTSGRFFAGGDPGGTGMGTGGGPGAGLDLLRDPAWRLGVALAAGLGRARRASEHPSLAGTQDIDRAARAVVFGGYSTPWLSATLRIATDIEGADQGTLVFFDLAARYRATPRLTISAGPGLTWADQDYTTTFFSVTPAHSAASGLPVYDAKGGLHALRFGLGASYRIDRQWILGARLGVARLDGDAASSPITLERDQRLAAVFASYSF
jgi:MipA family protein